MNNLILRLDISGRPVQWLNKESAALLYVRDQVAWEAGEHSIRLLGGYSRLTGQRSYLDLNTIVATRGITRLRSDEQATPHLCNQALFRRDAYLCMYCGGKFSAHQLTRDHVIPRSRGGRDIWENVVSACKPCNTRKGNRTLAELVQCGETMRLLAVPYRPNAAEGLLLQNRLILADQMQFLKAHIGKNSRLQQH